MTSKGIILLATVLFITTIASAQENAKNMFSNQEIPDVEIQDLDGKKVNLADFVGQGKISIISFWATWCSPCKKELNNISYMYEDWQELYNAQLLAISIDDSRNVSKVKSYANGESWEYIVLVDSNSDLKRALNFQTVPYTLIVDQNGHIVYKHSGYVEGDEYELEDRIVELATIKSK